MMFRGVPLPRPRLLLAAVCVALIFVACDVVMTFCC